MADINLQRKSRSTWIWVVLAVILFAVVMMWALGTSRTDLDEFGSSQHDTPGAQVALSMTGGSADRL